jgi:hypothetical protein
VIGHELAVEQRKAPDPKPGNQMRQRYFRSISRATYHRFAEKCCAERDTVKAADKPSVLPGLD